jgi:hypothetical protein
MNKFCAAFSGVAKFLGKQWENTPAAPLSRFEDGHLLARAGKLPRSHQARGSGANHEEMRQIPKYHQSPCTGAFTLYRGCVG